MTSHQTRALLASLVFVLAGCVGSEPSQLSTPSSRAPPPAPVPTASAETGAVAGVVIDEEQRPVVGAHVALLQANLQTETDTAGAFTFNEVAPGTYTLFVQRLGYESTGVKLDVLAGEVTERTVLLTAVEVAQEPFLRILRHTSYIQFGNAWISFGTFLANSTGAHALLCQACVWHFEFPPKPQMAQSEATWQCSPCVPPLVNDDVWFLVSKNVTGSASTPINTYLSNRETFVWTEAHVSSIRSAEKNRAQFRTEAGGGSVGSLGASGISYNQRVEFFQTFTYHMDLPGNFTALPPA